jgi:mannose-6-phosphate isomerase-like protein (cupin superfamily)
MHSVPFSVGKEHRNFILVDGAKKPKIVSRSMVILPQGYREKRLHARRDVLEIFVLLRGDVSFSLQKGDFKVEEPTLVYFKEGEKHKLSGVKSESSALIVRIRTERPKIPSDFG